jgi:thiosulfate/3-mercaptopyruvate sulfurtransferase
MPAPSGNFKRLVKATTMYTTIVCTDALAGHLDGSWAIVDCRFDLQQEDWGRDQYLAAHVPSATYAHLATDLSGPTTGTNGRHPLPEIDQLAKTLGAWGIDQKTQVVAYDQDVGMYASRLWWMLRYLGHDAVAVLDGGWARWSAEQRPVRGGPETRAAKTFVAVPRPAMLADARAVDGMRGRPDARLIDARAPERFAGRTEPIDRVAGHIPGAVNHFFKKNTAPDGTMLHADALRDQYSALLGGTRANDTVLYCGSGVTACHNLLAMEHAGLSGARLYAGSWSEWSADPERGVEKS